MTSNFVNLRTHTNYSLSEGMLTSNYIAEFCKRDLQPACCITDTSNLFGVFEFSEKLFYNGIQPIIGMQINLFDKYFNENPNEVVLISKNEKGYYNLVALANKVNNCIIQNPSRSIHIDTLKFYKDDLIILGGGSENGYIGFPASKQDEKIALSRAENLKKIFKTNFYIEIQRHGLERDKKAEPILLDIANKLIIPIVATNDSFFKSRDEFKSHEILIMIDKGLTISGNKARLLSHNNYLKKTSEMNEIFSDLPEALENSIIIAKRCSFSLKEKTPLLPKFINSEHNKTEKDLIEELSLGGLKKRLNISSSKEIQKYNKYFSRLENELKIIKKMGFSGYFLIVSDFVKWSKSNSIPVGPGRGSGAGSIVAWALEITDLDPLKWGLLFERFLNPERISMPDFDIDFCQERRDEVINYIKEKYGEDHVAQIITFGSLQARAAVRDVGRVLEMPYGQVDRIAKLIPAIPANPVSLSKALEEETDLKREKELDEDVSRVIDVALDLEGLNRHVSTHAAGIVISQSPLGKSIPLYSETNDEIAATQFNQKYIEKAGLVKFDILGLKTLSIIARTEKLIKENLKNFDILKIKLNDKKVFEMLSRGETIGVFQLESKGMQNALRGLKPDRFEDIIAVVALYRPGPMENIPNYINRKHGNEKVEYMHEKLSSILEETFGIFIYQEQVMQAAQILAGYSLSSADILRRAMGKKDKLEMEMQKENFINGTNRIGISKKSSEEIFDQIAAFAGYGFNKSHAAAYALIAYQCAWLKYHYPHEFFSSLMTYDQDNTDKLSIFFDDLKRLSIDLFSPNINKSNSFFLVENDSQGKKAIRCSLSSLKNVGSEAVKNLVKIRDEKGFFSCIDDFINKTPLNIFGKRGLESLIKAGAFEDLYSNRKKLFMAIPIMLLHSQKTLKDIQNNQNSLFDNLANIELSKSFLDTSEWSLHEREINEFNALGYHINFHPLKKYSNILNKLNITSSLSFYQKFEEMKNSKFLKIAGYIKKILKRKSQKGGFYGVVEINDLFGGMEIIFDQDNLNKFLEIYKKDSIFIFDIELRFDKNFGFRFIEKRTQEIDNVFFKNNLDIEFEIYDRNCIKEIKEKILKVDSGNSNVIFKIKKDDQFVSLITHEKVNLSKELLNKFFQIEGINSIKFH